MWLILHRTRSDIIGASQSRPSDVVRPYERVVSTIISRIETLEFTEQVVKDSRLSETGYYEQQSKLAPLRSMADSVSTVERRLPEGMDQSVVGVLLGVIVLVRLVFIFVRWEMRKRREAFKQPGDDWSVNIDSSST